MFRMTWRGAQCYCPLGQKPAGTSCVDTNECENNVCDQICQVTVISLVFLPITVMYFGFLKMYLELMKMYLGFVKM